MLNVLKMFMRLFYIEEGKQKVLSILLYLVNDDNDDDYDDLTEEEEWVRWCQVIREEEPLHHVGVHVGGRRSPGII